MTHRALRRGLENPIDREQLIIETKTQAREALHMSGLDDARIDSVWQLFDDNYFLRHRSDEIAWHTRWLAEAGTDTDTGLVAVRRQEQGDSVEAVLYTPRIHHTFAHATAVLDELGMTIVDARVMPIANDYSLDSFIFMETDKRIDIDAARLRKIRESLERTLTASDDDILSVTRTAPRQVRMFTTPTVVGFAGDTPDGRTVLELVAADRPGLLSKVGKAFIAEGVDIDTAKIMTIGERAEDVFYVTDESGRSLDPAARERLRDALIAAFEQSPQGN